MGVDKRYDVVALGELLIDFTQNGTSGQGNPLFEANPGGAPCNVLAMLGNLGKKTAFIGKVGDDMFGHTLAKTIKEVGISDEGLRFDKDVRTTLAFVQTFEDGDRDFSFYRNPGADMMLNEDELDLRLLSDCRIFHFGTLSMTAKGCERATKRAVEQAKANGALISFDPNLREPLWESLDVAKEKTIYGIENCDILKISDNEVLWLTGKDDVRAGAQEIWDKYEIGLMAVTLGKNGSMVFYKDKVKEGKAYLQKDTIETTGAGDTFCGCLLNAVLDNGLDGFDDESLEDMLKTAAAASSVITTRKGALRVMPSKEEIEALING